MKSRRDFVKQGTLAATALLAANPIKVIAGAGSVLNSITGGHRTFILLYTANLSSGTSHRAIRFIKEINNSGVPALLVNAGGDQSPDLSYDLAIHPNHHDEYTIIHKGGIKTAFLYAKPGETGLLQRINRLSAYLKKELNCRLVVCLSELGYKNNHGADDLALAEGSDSLDIIIGVHPRNTINRPVVAFNRKRGEVILHPVNAGSFAFGKIEIDFDDQQRKRKIDLVHELPA